MRLYFIILNCVIFDLLKNVQGLDITYTQEGTGASHKALMKLQELKNLELNILNDMIEKDKKDTNNNNKNNHNNKLLYEKYHCISNDLLFPKDNINNDESKNNKDNNEKKKDSTSKDENNKETSFINYVSSFIGNFRKNETNLNKINDTQKYNKVKEKNEIIYKEEKNGIEKVQHSSYVELKGFNIIKNMFSSGKSEPRKEDFEGGNFGSFFLIFGPNGTDYPWSCLCDPIQLKEYQLKKREFVLCKNQLDTSLQNNELLCSVRNASQNFYLPFLIVFLIAIIFQ